MAGTSSRPLLQKLGIKSGARVPLAGAPADIKICAIDKVWLGLKFVIRRKDR